MAGFATKETNKSVSAFIESIDNSSKREDSKLLIKTIEEITGYPAKIWGDNFIIGFENILIHAKVKKKNLNGLM